MSNENGDGKKDSWAKSNLPENTPPLTLEQKNEMSRIWAENEKGLQGRIRKGASSSSWKGL